MVVVHTIISVLRTWRQQMSGSLRPAWFVKLVPGLPELLHKENLSSKTETKETKILGVKKTIAFKTSVSLTFCL